MVQYNPRSGVQERKRERERGRGGKVFCSAVRSFGRLTELLSSAWVVARPPASASDRPFLPTLPALLHPLPDPVPQNLEGDNIDVSQPIISPTRIVYSQTVERDTSNGRSHHLLELRDAAVAARCSRLLSLPPSLPHPLLKNLFGNSASSTKRGSLPPR